MNTELNVGQIITGLGQKRDAIHIALTLVVCRQRILVQFAADTHGRRGGEAEKTPKDVLLAWVKAFNDRDPDAPIPLYHPEAVNHQVAAGGPVVGRDAIIRDERSFFADFPDTHTKVESMYQDGDVVATEWSGGATWIGEFAGNKPNGNTFTIKGAGSSESRTARSSTSVGTGTERGGFCNWAFRSEKTEAGQA